MDNQDNEFDKIESAAADKRWQQDIDDLNNELSGNDVGRTARFLSPEVRDRLLAQKQGKPSRAMNALEMALMANPAYAEIHKAAVNETRAAQRTAQAFQDDVDLALSEVRANIASMLDEAVTLPDGRKAFMGKDGLAWTVDGERVDDAITAGIDWSGRPASDEYQELLDREEALGNASHLGRQLSNRLGEIHNELNDEDEPPSVEAIENYRAEIEAIEAELNSSADELNIKTENKSIENDVAPDIAALNQNAVPTL
ncbi:MAG: hypothetical protein ACSHYC_00135 [Alphaproteobacteria bacterium]